MDRPIGTATEAAIEWRDDLTVSLRAKLELARQYVARRPDQPESWLLLADNLRKNGLIDETLTRLDEAIARFPENARLRFAQALAFQEADDIPGALRSLDGALAVEPAHREARLMRCRLLIQTNALGSAVAVLEGVDALVGRGRAFVQLEMPALLADGRLSELVSLCERERKRYPGDTAMTYYHAIALVKLGRADEAREIIRLDRFIDIAPIPVPAGFTSTAQFCERLALEIGQNANFVHDPKGKSSRGAFAAWHVRNPASPTVDIMLAAIRNGIDAYVAKLADKTDAFTASRPRRAKLSFWAVRSDVGGRQASHYHPDGWLSGVFYIAAPRAEGGRFDGSILLGALKERGDSPLGTLEVEPIPGRLLLFPSYVPHATKATRIPGSRLAVSFDVMPLSGGGPE